MNAAILHYYQAARRHQINTFGNSGLWIQGIDQRQFTGGGAAYQCHAIAAYNHARGQIRFRADLAATNRAYKKRQAAAKRGWKNRR